MTLFLSKQGDRPRRPRRDTLIVADDVVVIVARQSGHVWREWPPTQRVVVTPNNDTNFMAAGSGYKAVTQEA